MKYNCPFANLVEGLADEEDIVRFAGALERGSEHPLARAIMMYASEREINIPEGMVTEFEAIPGKGVVGRVDGELFGFGNELLVHELTGKGLPSWCTKFSQTGAGAHATVMYLVFESFGVAGAIAAADKPKLSAAEGVAALQALGCEVYLLTGDARGPAIHVAAEVGIDGDHVLSEVLPDQKANAVSALLDPSQRKLVAMVGDGINDTPALATADVSIAMGAGSDAALEVGQIVLMHDDVRDVARAIQLSRATMRKIHQNFGWALGYNLILVPLAAFGILPPELSSACMALSSVSVVTNPASNMKLGNGFAPVPELIEAGVNVCLGTDGAASNNAQNMFRELGLLALIHKGTHDTPQCISADGAFRMATRNAGKALGLPIGSIEVGKKADLAMLDIDSTSLTPLGNPVAALAYSANGSEVCTVIIDGRIVMREHELTTIDEERVRHEIARICSRIRVGLA